MRMCKSLINMARPTRFEHVTAWFLAQLGFYSPS